VTQPQAGKSRPSTTLEAMVKRDRDRQRFNSRHTHYTPEYQAWLKRQAKKGRNR
jgi:hypothetical protein